MMPLQRKWNLDSRIVSIAQHRLRLEMFQQLQQLSNFLESLLEPIQNNWKNLKITLKRCFACDNV